jgi:hypothetical protein
LTQFSNAGAIHNFDIGKRGDIAFDRQRGNSHIVSIELPGEEAQH